MFIDDGRHCGNGDIGNIRSGGQSAGRWIGIINVYSLYVTGSNIFAGTDTVVYRSIDNGVNWTPANTGLPNMQVNVFTAIGTTIFAGTFGGGIFVSANNGTSGWTPANSGLANLNVWSFMVIGDTIFAGIDSMVYRSANKGASWTAAASGLGNTDVRSLVVVGNKIFAGTYGSGVYVSADKGTSWDAVDTGLASLNVAALTVLGNNIFAATMHGVYLTADNGATWNEINTGLMNFYLSSFAVIGNNLFTGSLGSGVFVSSNNGASWSVVDTGLTTQDVRCLAVSGGTIFAGTNGGGVFKSADNGMTWTAVNSGFTGIRRPVLQSSNLAAFKIISPSAGGSKASIVFSLVRREQINITIYNLSGHAVRSLVNKQFEPGTRTLSWDTRTLTPGCYMVKMQTGTNDYVKNFTLGR